MSLRNVLPASVGATHASLRPSSAGVWLWWLLSNAERLRAAGSFITKPRAMQLDHVFLSPRLSARAVQLVQGTCPASLWPVSDHAGVLVRVAATPS